LPYWDEIQRLADHNRAVPSKLPETVDHGNPPSKRIQAVFLAGKRGKAYIKPRDATRILRGQNLLVSATACPELKAFFNTILSLCGGELIP
jgi:hypothetical protein